MINSNLFLSDCKDDIKLLKYKTKFFFCDCYGNDKDIDVQINDFVDKENVQIVNIKYALDNGCQYALLIYRKYEQLVVSNETKEDFEEWLRKME